MFRYPTAFAVPLQSPARAGHPLPLFVLASATPRPTLFGSCFRRLRRLVALVVVGAFAVGCMEPFLEVAGMSANGIAVSAGGERDAGFQVEPGAAQAAPRSAEVREAVAATPAPEDAAPEPGPQSTPVPGAQTCPCTHAVVASAAVPQVPAPVETSPRPPRPSAERLPASPTLDQHLRPPVVRG